MKEYEYYNEIYEDSKKPADEYMQNFMYALLEPEESEKYLKKCNEIIEKDHPEFLNMLSAAK
ncbi:MAG: hypothetical protein N2749_05465 [Clostridia bacterium]|nr:hypothetical protein [Clostridia bacterium]